MDGEIQDLTDDLEVFGRSQTSSLTGDYDLFVGAVLRYYLV